MGLHRVIDVLGTRFLVKGNGLLTVRLIAPENEWQESLCEKKYIHRVFVEESTIRQIGRALRFYSTESTHGDNADPICLAAF